MQHKKIFGAILLASCVIASPCLAGKLDQSTIPLKWIEPLLPEGVPEPAYPEYNKNNTLEKARAQMWAGQYRRALVTLENITKPKPVDIALIKGECCRALGRYDKASQFLTAPEVASDPAVLTLLARVDGDQGKLSSALDLLGKAIANSPDNIPARYYLGYYKEESGDFDGAKAAYQWFMDDPRNFMQQWLGHRQTFTNAQEVTYIAEALDRWATLTMTYQQDQQIHNTVLSMFVRAYNVIDTDYWPAHEAAAEFYISHDDPGHGNIELRQSLNANPSDADSWLLNGQVALQNFNFDGADQAVSAMRKVNPNSVDANLLQARNFLAQRIPKQALPCIQRVLENQPQNIEALGLLAGTYALLLQDDKTAEILKQVDAIQPNDALAYLEVGEQLASMRQYPRSAAMYEIAVKRAPWWTDARNGLGLLYTQSGDEAASRVVLDAAHSLDPYNIRTTNYLRLLDMMDKFAKKETAHFIVMYDPRQDPIIPEYFSDYLESIYKDVCGEFHFEPTQKTMIEVFPTHDAFSVRTTGAPWIATVGASTGRVIALVAPRRGEKTMGPFNWAQVLRHEFTHTVTLGQTDNRIAHWFTEGLAVEQEHSPMRWEWVPMLYSAVNKHELFPLDQLTWSFIRPRKPIDRQLAYAESAWICQYIDGTYGHDSILQMLEQFRQGKAQDEVFSIVLHKSETQFFEEFNNWCQSQVAGWGYDVATSKKYAAEREKAEALVKDHKLTQAVPLYEDLVKLRPVDLLPHQRLAGLYISKEVHQPEKAAQQLDILAAVDIKNNIYTKGAARLYRDEGKLDLATARAVTAVYIDPYDMDAHTMLADLYEKTGQTDLLDREKRVIVELTTWQDAIREGAIPPVPATQP